MFHTFVGLSIPFNPFIFTLSDNLVERSDLCFRDIQRELLPDQNPKRVGFPDSLLVAASKRSKDWLALGGYACATT
jgi:hypothetical protein